jgi:hypothetical protein
LSSPICPAPLVGFLPGEGLLKMSNLEKMEIEMAVTASRAERGGTTAETVCSVMGRSLEAMNEAARSENWDRYWEIWRMRSEVATAVGEQMLR